MEFIVGHKKKGRGYGVSLKDGNKLALAIILFFLIFSFLNYKKSSHSPSPNDTTPLSPRSKVSEFVQDRDVSFANKACLTEWPAH